MLVWWALQRPVYVAGDTSALHVFSCVVSRKSALASLGSSPVKIQQNVATQKAQLTISGAFHPSWLLGQYLMTEFANKATALLQAVTQPC